MEYSGPEKKSKEKPWPVIIIFLVGMHSILLGLFIYFFTDFFYKTFFGASVENIFFVRQSGTFLFLAGLFYLYPLVNLSSHYNLILVVVISKIVAVYFLVANAVYTSAPAMIYSAAFFDGLMALALVVVYFRLKVVSRQKNRSIRDAKAGLKEAV